MPAAPSAAPPADRPARSSRGRPSARMRKEPRRAEPVVQRHDDIAARNHFGRIVLRPRPTGKPPGHDPQDPQVPALLGSPPIQRQAVLVPDSRRQPVFASAHLRAVRTRHAGVPTLVPTRQGSAPQHAIFARRRAEQACGMPSKGRCSADLSRPRYLPRLFGDNDTVAGCPSPSPGTTSVPTTTRP